MFEPFHTDTLARLAAGISDGLIWQRRRWFSKDRGQEMCESGRNTSSREKTFNPLISDKSSKHQFGSDFVLGVCLK